MLYICMELRSASHNAQRTWKCALEKSFQCSKNGFRLRCWNGRIGDKENLREYFFPSREEASREVYRRIRKRLKHGYVLDHMSGEDQAKLFVQGLFDGAEFVSNKFEEDNYLQRSLLSLLDDFFSANFTGHEALSLVSTIKAGLIPDDSSVKSLSYCEDADKASQLELPGISSNGFVDGQLGVNAAKGAATLQERRRLASFVLQYILEADDPRRSSCLRILQLHSGWQTCADLHILSVRAERLLESNILELLKNQKRGYEIAGKLIEKEIRSIHDLVQLSRDCLGGKYDLNAVEISIIERTLEANGLFLAMPTHGSRRLKLRRAMSA